MGLKNNFILSDISEKISELVKTISLHHAELIETELKLICHFYNLSPKDLIIETHPDGIYKISILLSQFQITQQYTYGKK